MAPGQTHASRRYMQVGDATMAENAAAAAVGLSRSALASRLHRGWTKTDALQTPPRSYTPDLILRPPGPSLAYLPLAGGKYLFCIDADMSDVLENRRWIVRATPKRNKVYAAMRRHDDQDKFISLRRFITGLSSTTICCHNGNSLDCRRANLAPTGTEGAR